MIKKIVYVIYLVNKNILNLADGFFLVNYP